MTLVGDGHSLALSIEGWPRRLSAEGLGPPGPEPLLDAIPKTDRVTGAYVEGPSGAAFLVVHAIKPSSGWYDAVVLRRADNEWHELKVASDPVLIGYYSALVVRDGGVFGLLGHRANDEALDLSLKTGAERAEHALTNAARGFVRLEGPSDASVPTLPAGSRVAQVQARDDGTIYALELRGGSDGSKPAAILRWAPRVSEPTRALLPNVEPGLELRLSTRGSRVLVFGSDRYLAQERNGVWTRIPITLPPDNELLGAGDTIYAALATPDHELWLTLEHDVWGPRLLLRRPLGGEWTLVTAPPLSEQQISARPFVYEDGWARAQLEDDYGFPRYDALAWADDRLWVYASFGPLEHPFRGSYSAIRRNVVFAAGDVDADLEIATPAYADWSAVASDDRRAPGDCDPFWIILDTNGQADALDEAGREALWSLATDSEIEALGLLYIGEIDGRRELVLQARAEDRKAANHRIRQVGEALGRPVSAECRTRAPIEALVDYRGPRPLSPKQTKRYRGAMWSAAGRLKS